MTCATTRSTTPAAAPRTARGAAALPHDPGLDAILADPTLGSTAKALITVMIRNWAWFKDHCWPSDATLAARVGKSVGHVQRCLRELELAGRIFREKTAAVPNGRRIWLLWRCPGGRAGAQPEPAPARTAPAAPARDERVVIVNEGREPGIRPASRPRPEADPLPTPVRVAPPPAASTSPAEEPPAPRGPLPTVQEARETAPAPVPEAPRGATDPALPEAVGGPLAGPAPTGVPDAPAAAALPLDLGALATPRASCSPSPRTPRTTPPGPSASPPPAAAAARSGARRPGLDLAELAQVVPPPAAAAARSGARRPGPGLGLDLAELARVVGETADPILAAELARRTAPPPPPEPPPRTLPTAELIATLPGRYDRIMVVARRLSEETGDFQAASQRTFETMAEAVARRSVPASVLIDCWRQGMGPRAVHKGKVLVAAWKRQAPRRC